MFRVFYFFIFLFFIFYFLFYKNGSVLHFIAKGKYKRRAKSQSNYREKTSSSSISAIKPGGVSNQK